MCVCVHAHVSSHTVMPTCIGLGVNKDLDLVAGKHSNTGRKDKGRLGFEMRSDLEVARFYYYR